MFVVTTAGPLTGKHNAATIHSITTEEPVMNKQITNTLDLSHLNLDDFVEQLIEDMQPSVISKKQDQQTNQSQLAIFVLESEMLI